MDPKANRRSIKPSNIAREPDLSTLYPNDLNMFNIPPDSDLSIEEFKLLAIERINLYRILEAAAFKGHILYSDDWRNCIKEDLLKEGLKRYARLLNGYGGNSPLDQQSRRADQISHFILRISYCCSEELRKYFLSRELEWFRLKFAVQSVEAIKEFFVQNKLDYAPISISEKTELKQHLMSCTAGMLVLENTIFYKVPWTEALSLVRNRKVYTSNGFSYVPAQEMVVCLLSKFRAKLSKSLAHYCQQFPKFHDERLLGFLRNLPKIHSGNTYTAPPDKKDAVDPAALDGYSRKHFPLCMRHIHQVLRSEHHLKHFCRLTYGLFLKAIGLMYDDAMQFWRAEFTKKIDSKQFESKHVYNIQHVYGKVGKMTNYSPYSCAKIINSSVGPGEHHGCPFRHWDPNVTRQQMIDGGISQTNADEIKELIRTQHYQIACSKYFEYSHGKAAPSIINHPNQYYDESVKIELGNAQSKK